MKWLFLCQIDAKQWARCAKCRRMNTTRFIFSRRSWKWDGFCLIFIALNGIQMMAGLNLLYWISATVKLITDFCSSSLLLLFLSLSVSYQLSLRFIARRLDPQCLLFAATLFNWENGCGAQLNSIKLNLFTVTWFGLVFAFRCQASVSLRLLLLSHFTVLYLIFLTLFFEPILSSWN